MITRYQYLQNIKNIIIEFPPYGWGQWGPGAYDCSGVVSRALQLDNKLNAQDLYEMFADKPVDRLQAPPGALYFYNQDGLGNVHHVMSVVSHWSNGGIILAGARGGDSTTTTLDRAKEQGAFVDICTGDYWLSKFVCAVDPFQG